MIRYGKKPERSAEKKERQPAYQGKSTGAGTFTQKFMEGGSTYGKPDVPQPDPRDTKPLPEDIVDKAQKMYKRETGKNPHKEIARMILEKQRLDQLKQMLSWKQQMEGMVQQQEMDQQMQQQMPQDPYGGGGNPFGNGGDGGQYF